ncbi:class I SAM-dependent methyltransferase [Cumulibacter manganitolerans]|uniref:class I SAM-dependent methyltransferase n=1 Tax=Cumulibacter manganitolerans TaxID=1884992 RepID=UPI001297C119|nr:class I SAM-dependent methyltransferase [Cumulibacter manganitolerans]
MSTGYAMAYRLGIRPWERAGAGGQASFEALLEREENERGRPLGRALDLGCGRGRHTRELAARGWEAVGIDNIPRALAQARAAGDGATFVEADVTALRRAKLGGFDFFLDIGCLHGLDAAARAAAAGGITELANPGATMLLLAFRPHPLPLLPKGLTRADVESTFPAWRLESTGPADTAGMPRPLRRTEPQWYRLRLAS